MTKKISLDRDFRRVCFVFFSESLRCWDFFPRSQAKKEKTLKGNNRINFKAKNTIQSSAKFCVNKIINL